MSVTLRPGTRLFSAVDSTELIAVRAPSGPLGLTLGGFAPALSVEDRTVGVPAIGHDGGVALGKRYTNVDGSLELLCTKPGRSVPAVDGELLTPKEAKPLPSSD